MRKAAISIKGEWGDQRTKYPASSEFVADNDLTAGSKNYETTLEGILTKRKGDVVYNPDDVLAAAPKDQYESIFSDGIRHLLVAQSGEIQYSVGDRTFNSVTNGTGFVTGANFQFATILDRVYGCNGINGPIVYDKTAVYGGAPANPVPRIDSMGAQAPSAALTAAVGVAGNVPAGTYRYKVTFIYYDLSESNGGPTSNLVSPGISSQIDLTSVPLGGHGVTARKIYRDNNNGVFRFITTINDNTTTVATDNLAVGTSVIPEDNNAPPIFGQIVGFLDRVWVGQIPSEPYTIRHSSVSKPDIFPDNNFIFCNEGDPITGFAVYLDRIIVFNRQSMGQIVGRTSNSFRYADIQGSVGCVDNRSIQVRTIKGVPTLIWLSDKGVYGYNGNSVVYLSDSIEDLVNLNIQQAVRTKDKNTQVVNFTTIDPQRVWDDQNDWENVSPYGSLTNIATKDLNNKIQVPTGSQQNPGQEGTRNGVIPNATMNISLTQTSDWTGDNTIGLNGTSPVIVGLQFVAAQFRPRRSGTLTAAFVSGVNTNGSAESPGGGGYHLWTDVSGLPDVDLGTAVGQHVTAGVLYNLVAHLPGSANGNFGGAINTMQVSPTFSRSSNVAIVSTNGVNWVGSDRPAVASYSMTADPIADAGQWLSTVIDTKSDNTVGGTINHSGTYPASTSGVTTIEAGNTLDGGGNLNVETTQVINNLNGTTAVTITDKRYWQVRVQLNTTDNRNVPIVGAVSLTFATSGTWVSEPIDTTHTVVNPNTSVNTVTSLDTLSKVDSIPGGATVVLEARSSANSDMSGASAWFTSIGSVPIARYVQTRLTITKNGSDQTPEVTSVTLEWTLQSVLKGTAINTGIVGGPAGWDIFQTDDTNNGGTILYEVRSDPAPSTGTYYTATPNDFFPTAVPKEQYVQWKATITSTANNVPLIDAVVVSWLITNVPSIRVASLFFNRSYYLAAAEFDETSNNIMLILDGEGKWRVWRDRNVATLGLFFNDPYYGDATEGKLSKLFEGFLDKGTTNIEFDIRSKAYDFSTQDADLRYVKKIVRQLKVTGIGTGATYTCFYSLDGGKTFEQFYTDTGATSFTTTDDDELFEVRLKAAHSLSTKFSGRTVMWRILSNDANNVKIEGVRLEVLVRRGEVSINV